MGAIWYHRIEFVATISELTGYKSGLALSKAEIVQHVPEFEEWFAGDDDDRIRIRAEEVEELFGDLLFELGAVRSPGISVPHIDMFHRYKGDQGKLAIWEAVMDVFRKWGEAHEEGPYRLDDFVALTERVIGSEGAAMALELAERIEESKHKRPWYDYRRTKWQNTRDLAELFDSGNFGSPHGKFFDQRFIDYLDRNFESIDTIHWRQFEGLTAEFFDKCGFRVALGPGGNDDGVDVRVWRSDAPSDGPPAILVQCKRQKDKVGKVVVKALWADVAAERAATGLIVTTSALSPGARKVLTARSYPVTEVNRRRVRTWIRAMRSPGTGIFMGE